MCLGQSIAGGDPVARDVLRAERLSVTYRTRRGTIEAISDVELALKAGEFLSVLGPSGCGKSTLLKAGAGLLRPSSGRMLIDGSPIEGPRPDIGVVFQQPTLLPWKTVIDNVMLPIRTLGLEPHKGRRKAMDYLRLTGLEGFARNYPHELSGGMQQRVGIARGLVHDPQILLMDEPFAALDAMTREHMMQELQQIWMFSRGSVLFITHSIPEAVFLSDRIIVMSARPGRVMQEIPVGLSRPRMLHTMADPEFAAICNQLRTLFKTMSDSSGGFHGAS
jgi:NitT/TauT family transport system ATP-binding protein